MTVATYGFDNENYKTMKGEIHMDYAKNKKYFQPVNLKLGIIVCIIGLILFAATPIAGIVGLAIGAFLIYLQVGGRPSDADIDAAVTSQLSNMKAAHSRSWAWMKMKSAKLLRFPSMAMSITSQHRLKRARMTSIVATSIRQLCSFSPAMKFIAILMTFP